MAKPFSYDTDCEALAIPFLEDCNLPLDKYKQRLAQAIQNLIEAELEDYEFEERKAAIEREKGGK
jgi:hypothetical protein